MDDFQPPAPGSFVGRGRVTTLGQFIIDHFEASAENGERVSDPPAIGGGGIYAITAARLFLPAEHCGYICDVGLDMPPDMRTEFEALGEMVWFRERKGNTTRALNKYSGAKVGEGHQTFTYLSPTLQLTPSDLLFPGSPFADPPPEWIHVVCDVTRATAISHEAESFRKQGWVGSMLWEPLLRPTEQFTTIQYAALARMFAVFSPNHLELQTILDAPDADVETCARLFHGYLAMSPGPVPAIIVRAGEHGAFTLSREWTGWVPAFWQPEDANHVVDVTGAGNAFMGGLAAGLFISQGDFRVASIYAATAASFAVEQRGIPVLSKSPRHELWNGAFPWHRLQKMARRVQDLEGQYEGSDNSNSDIGH